MFTTQSFLESFWSNFLADAVVLFIASVLLPFFLSWRDLPNVRLIDSVSRRRIFSLKKKDDEWTTNVRTLIHNRGRKILEKYYWEIYLEKGIPYELDQVVSYLEKVGVQTETIGKYIRIYGYIEMPIFPLDDIDFPYALKIRMKEKRRTIIYYYFRTEYGQSPFWAWFAIWFKKFFLLKKLIVQ